MTDEIVEPLPEDEAIELTQKLAPVVQVSNTRELPQ